MSLKVGCVRVEAHCEKCHEQSVMAEPREVYLRITRHSDWHEIDGTPLSSSVFYEWHNGKLTLFCGAHAPSGAKEARPV